MKKTILIVLLVLVCTVLAGRQRYEFVSTNLIAHYKMNDNAASAVVVDSTGDHNGTYKDKDGNINTDTGDSIGRINGALDFDGLQANGGTDEYVEIADHADFTPISTPFSISAWVYPHDVCDFAVASKGVASVDGEWVFGISCLRVPYAWVFDDDAAANCQIGRAAGVDMLAYQASWIHLVMTYDGGALSSGIKMYLNGELLDAADSQNDADKFVAVEAVGHAINIGTYDTYYADGLIDNVMFFNIKLSTNQVKQIHNAGRIPRSRYNF